MVLLGLSLVLPFGAGAEPPGEIRFVGKSRIATARGTFADWRLAEVVYNGDWHGARVVIVVDLATIDTDNKKRDERLKSSDFFDVARYPELTLRISQVQEKATGGLRAVAEIDLHGVTGTLPVEFQVISEEPLVVAGELVLSRSAFGIGKRYRRFSLISIKDEVPVTFRATIPVSLPD